jgi:hypothetical protein
MCRKMLYLTFQYIRLRSLLVSYIIFIEVKINIRFITEKLFRYHNLP